MEAAALARATTTSVVIGSQVSGVCVKKNNKEAEESEETEEAEDHVKTASEDYSFWFLCFF
ncbi:MAG: hypothetical protein QF858_02925 [Candidatus Pacebacteria bacterium]|jgi:Na+/glutamate symporter|nr:hypothetical protein [Candidatus Paceibacterota bacterium]|tara:strand:- start:4079 stop:4261 length:183 start_codon:yes stop_codon:yes gene_type:complete